MIPPPDPAILREAAHRALAEDIGPADLTATALIPHDATASARITAKAPGTLAGLPVATEVFRQLDPALHFQPLKNDGDSLLPGDPVASLKGNARALLSGERSALNFLQRLSGIATLTRRFVDAASGTRARILDTRKTTPGLRLLEKYAVRCGGGTNHRTGLYDAFMIKDNHLAFLGGCGYAEAVRRARALDPEAHLTAEADTLDQVRAWLDAGVDRILLDNMSLEQLQEAVTLANGRTPLEASGNMSLDRIPAVAATGVDFISVGALTHSAPALDLSLDWLP